MTKQTKHERRRADLQHIHRSLMEQHHCSSTEAVRYLANELERSEWTVWAWISERSVGYTIPADTLELLKLRLGMNE